MRQVEFSLRIRVTNGNNYGCGAAIQVYGGGLVQGLKGRGVMFAPKAMGFYITGNGLSCPDSEPPELMAGIPSFQSREHTVPLPGFDSFERVVISAPDGVFASWEIVAEVKEEAPETPRNDVPGRVTLPDR